MSPRVILGVSILLAQVVQGALDPPSAQGIRVNGPLARANWPGSWGETVYEFSLASDGVTAVFLADPEGEERFELFAAPADGSGTWRRLSLDGSWCVSPSRTGAGRVVFLSAFARFGPYELYSAPLDGSAPAVRVSQALPPTGQIGGHAVVPGSGRVLYRAAPASQGARELFSAPLDGSGVPVEIGDALVPGGEVLAFLASPDGGTVVFTSDRASDGVVELWAAPVDGSGVPVRLSGTMIADGDVRADFVFAAGGTRVVFAADRASDEVFELWSAPLDGGTPPARLSGTQVAGGDAGTFRIAPGGNTVLFLADRAVDEAVQLWSAPVAGGADPILLGGASNPYRRVRDFATRRGRVAYLADESQYNAYELFSVPLSGGSSVRLTPALTPDPDDGFTFAFAAGGTQVVYSTDQDAEDVFELWSVPASGAAPPRKLNAPLPPEGDVQGFVVARGRVVYRADAPHDEQLELWSVPLLQGGGAPRRLCGELSLLGSVESDFALAGTERVVYRADAAVDATIALWSVPLDASEAPLELSMPLDPGELVGDVTEFRWTPDGRRILYGAPRVYDARRVLPNVFAADLIHLGEGTIPVVYLGYGSGIAVSREGDQAAFTVGDPTCLYDPCQVTLRSASTDGSEGAHILTQPLGTIEDVSFGIGGARVVYNHRYWFPGYSESGLYVSPSDGSVPPAVVSDPQGFLGTYALAAHGQWIAYEELAGGLERLASVPIDLGLPPRELVQHVQAFGLMPDEDTLCLLADPAGSGLEFFSSPVDGSTPPLWLGTAGPLADQAFRITADGKRVVYVADRALWSLAIDPPGAGAPVKLSAPPIPPGGGIDHTPDVNGEPDFVLSPDSTRAVYRSAQFDYGTYELFSVPLDGSLPPVRLHPALAPGYAVERGAYRITADSRRVVFAAPLGGTLELWSAPLDGSAPPVALNAPFPPGGGLRGLSGAGAAFAVAPDGTQVAYRADQFVPGVIELFLVRSDGSRGPRRLNTVLVPGGDVLDFAFSPDGSWVAYRADQAIDEVVELFVSTADPLRGGHARAR